MRKVSVKIFLLLFLLPICSLAQKSFYKQAEKEFANEEYYSAIESYKKSYAKTDHGDKAEVLFKVGVCYMKISDYKQAETWFDKCIKAKYSDPIAWYDLAVCKKYLLKYAEAITAYQNYLRGVPNAGQTFISSCDLAREWMDKPTNYMLENMAQINSKDDDMLPVFVNNNNDLYFISNRQSNAERVMDKSTGKMNSEVFFTRCDTNGKWSDPFPEAAYVNASWNVNSFYYDSLHRVLYFSREAVEKIKKEEIKRKKLFLSASKSGKNTEELQIAEASGSFNFETPFVVSLDELIFSSDMPGGFGGYDLWSVKYNRKTKIWDKPVNLGATVNSSFNEKAPYISAGHLLYFSSDREDGMGGYDIYSAKPSFIGDEWKEAENMKYPINSSHDDMGIIFDGNNDTGYISSNREGGKGGYDIFKFYRKGN